MSWSKNLRGREKRKGATGREKQSFRRKKESLCGCLYKGRQEKQLFLLVEKEKMVEEVATRREREKLGFPLLGNKKRGTGDTEGERFPASTRKKMASPPRTRGRNKKGAENPPSLLGGDGAGINLLQ